MGRGRGNQPQRVNSFIDKRVDASKESGGLFDMRYSYSTLFPRTQKGRQINLVSKAIDPKIYSLADLKQTEWRELNTFRDSLRQEYEEDKLELPIARMPEDNEKRIVVADIHGNYRNLYRLLLAMGAINRDGSRNPGYWICQLGDLIHGGEDVFQADSDTSLLASRWVDCQLIGNHDLAFLTQKINSTFAKKHAELAPGLQPRLNSGFRQGQWRSSVAVDGWLISHAGVNPGLLASSGINKDLEIDFSKEGIEKLADSIEDAFIDKISAPLEDQKEEPLFDWIGPNRGGSDPAGSMFWSGWPELQKSYVENPSFHGQLKQIVGHTPQNEPICVSGCWNIDLKGIDEGSGSVSALLRPAPTDKNQPELENDWQSYVLERAQRPAF